jgi:hypothetical protein
MLSDLVMLSDPSRDRKKVRNNCRDRRVDRRKSLSLVASQALATLWAGAFACFFTAFEGAFICHLITHAH